MKGWLKTIKEDEKPPVEDEKPVKKRSVMIKSEIATAELLNSKHPSFIGLTKLHSVYQLQQGFFTLDARVC